MSKKQLGSWLPRSRELSDLACPDVGVAFPCKGCRV